MNRRLLLTIAVSSAALLLPGSLSGPVFAGGIPVVTKTATLAPEAGISKLKGKAKSKVKGAQAELEVSIENAVKLAGTQISVRVDGVPFGSVTVGALGAAKLSLSTALGHSVPSIASGSVVTIIDADGNTILRGSF